MPRARAAAGASPARVDGPAVRVDHHVADQLARGRQALALRGWPWPPRSGASSRSARWSATIRLRSSGMRAVERAQPGLDVRQPRAPAVAIGELGGHHGARPASSSCRRRRGRHRARCVEHDRLEAAQHLAGHRAVRAAADLEVHVRLGHLEVAEERRRSSRRRSAGRCGRGSRRGRRAGPGSPARPSRTAGGRRRRS